MHKLWRHTQARAYSLRLSFLLSNNKPRDHTYFIDIGRGKQTMFFSRYPFQRLLNREKGIAPAVDVHKFPVL